MGYSWVFYPRNYDHSARYFQSMLCHYFADLRLEFAPIDGADRACRGSSATDNNPAHYRVVSGRYKIQAKTSLDPSSTHKNRVLLLKTPELLCICWVFGGSIGLFLLIKASKPMNISCNRALWTFFLLFGGRQNCCYLKMQFSDEETSNNINYSFRMWLLLSGFCFRCIGSGASSATRVWINKCFEVINRHVLWISLKSSHVNWLNDYLYHRVSFFRNASRLAGSKVVARASSIVTADANCGPVQKVSKQLCRWVVSSAWDEIISGRIKTFQRSHLFQPERYHKSVGCFRGILVTSIYW